MPIEPNRPFLGVLLGFACVFFLFVKREGKKPLAEDAEMLIQRAQQEMRERQAKNRERTVQIITQKNNLQALVDQTQKTVAGLEERAEFARHKGNAERADDLLAERDQYQATLTQVKNSLASAMETSEAVKIAMRQQEEGIRAKTAEALAMKAAYRQTQIEFEIEKSRLSMTTTKAGAWFEQAHAKIQQAQARRDLMAQLRKTTEALEEAAEAAADRGESDLSRRLLSERDELKKAGLNPNLWSS
jgi:phage shock protein A